MLLWYPSIHIFRSSPPNWLRAAHPFCNNLFKNAHWIPSCCWWQWEVKGEQNWPWALPSRISEIACFRFHIFWFTSKKIGNESDQEARWGRGGWAGWTWMTELYKRGKETERHSPGHKMQQLPSCCLGPSVSLSQCLVVPGVLVILSDPTDKNTQELKTKPHPSGTFQLCTFPFSAYVRKLST